MKNRADVENRLKMELIQWFELQCKFPKRDYYLYCLPTTVEHDGGFLFLSEDPPNPEYELAHPERVNKGATIEQNFFAFKEIVGRLPVLSL